MEESQKRSKSKITQNFPEDPLFDITGQKSLMHWSKWLLFSFIYAQVFFESHCIPVSSDSTKKKTNSLPLAHTLKKK